MFPNYHIQYQFKILFLKIFYLFVLFKLIKLYF